MTMLMILTAMGFTAFSAITFIATGARDEEGPSGLSLFTGGCILTLLQVLAWLLVGLRLAGGGL